MRGSRRAPRVPRRPPPAAGYGGGTAGAHPAPLRHTVGRPPERAHRVTMFTSQSLRAVVRPGALTVREQRLDDVVHQLDVRGTLGPETIGELARRVDAALAAGVRWLIVDIAETASVADEALAAIVAAGRELRSRKGELIVAG